MLEFFLEAFHSNKIASNVYVRVSTAGIQRACVIVSARISVSAEDKSRLGTQGNLLACLTVFFIYTAKKYRQCGHQPLISGTGIFPDDFNDVDNKESEHHDEQAWELFPDEHLHNGELCIVFSMKSRTIC